RCQGVERVTCVPGESYLAALDALYDGGVQVVICRNEGGAAMMAEAYGKLTGRPGVCFVTRGPGATNACHGVHIAMQDSTPMLLFIGQVDRSMREREAFQEVDYRAMFGGMAKWVVEIDRADRIPELVARAYRVAMQGRPGPVVISLPEDMLVDTCDVADAPRVEPVQAWPAPGDLHTLQDMLAQARQPLAALGGSGWDETACRQFADVAQGAGLAVATAIPRAAPFPADHHSLQDMLAQARQPIAVLGGSGWDETACRQFADFAQRAGLPVATSFRRAALFPADHPCYAGDLGIGPDARLKARVADADLLLLVGGRLSEMPSSSYTLLDIPVPRQKLVHVHPGAEELGRVYQPALGIQAGPRAFSAALAQVDVPAAPAWQGSAAQAHADYLDWTETPRHLPGEFQYGQALAWLRERLPRDAMVCNGAGNYAGWLHRHHRFHTFGTQLAPTSGSMGYGVPAAVLAKLQFPQRTVLAFAGD